MWHPWSKALMFYIAYTCSCVCAESMFCCELPALTALGLVLTIGTQGNCIMITVIACHSDNSFWSPPMLFLLCEEEKQQTSLLVSRQITAEKQFQGFTYSLLPLYENDCIVTVQHLLDLFNLLQDVWNDVQCWRGSRSWCWRANRPLRSYTSVSMSSLRSLWLFIKLNKNRFIKKKIELHITIMVINRFIHVL